MIRNNLYYEDHINNFLNSDNDYILGKISNNNSSAETRIQ